MHSLNLRAGGLFFKASLIGILFLSALTQLLSLKLLFGNREKNALCLKAQSHTAQRHFNASSTLRKGSR